MKEIKIEEFLELFKNQKIDLLLYEVNQFKIQIYLKNNSIHLVNDESDYVLDLKNAEIKKELGASLIRYIYAFSSKSKIFSYQCVEILKKLNCNVLTSTSLITLEEMFSNSDTTIASNSEITFILNMLTWRYNVFLDAGKLICEVIAKKINQDLNF